MTIALLDNGSLEPAATLNLRAVAAAVSAHAGVSVTAVSWKHSDRVPAARLGGVSGKALHAWTRARLAAGETNFIYLPFFISPQGAIGSALRRDLQELFAEWPRAHFRFAAGLAEGDTIPRIVAARIRACRAAIYRECPPVIVVDHGGPSPVSAKLRNEFAAAVRAELGPEVRSVTPASMEGEDHAHNRPLLASVLESPEIGGGDVIIAPLFLSPGRHAGPDGDIVQICRAAEARHPALRCHVTELVGTHPRAVDSLVDSLRATLSDLTLFASHEPLA